MLNISGGGEVDIYITATAIIDNEIYESVPSSHAYMYYQGFETAMGNWKMIAEDSSKISFVRSTVESNYAGSWGIKNLGAFPWYPALWTILASPKIPEYEGATKAKFEFVHRHQALLPQNGYQVGYMHSLPTAGQPYVTGYNPITEVSYGYPYNSTSSSALQSEFGVPEGKDVNFGLNYSYWNGWYMSGFDVSEIIGNGKGDYLVIGLAGDYFDLLDVHIDEVAILVY